jgi:hypothetical protein
MISVSDAWIRTHKESLLPESFLEITVDITDVDAPNLAEVTSEHAASISNHESMVGGLGVIFVSTYATLEWNRWVLDGSKSVVPDSAPYATSGYVSSNDEDSASVVVRFPGARSVAGLTITWDAEQHEYPTLFDIFVEDENDTWKRIGSGSANSLTTVWDQAIENFDAIKLQVTEWNTPDRRARINRICFGVGRIFDKTDVLEYTHEQTGSLNSSELPKSAVDFTLNNVDGLWNPRNPTGLGKYLSERQAVNVRYGLAVDGVVNWIQGGRFYLSEWKARKDGYGANFVARDILDYMLNTPYTGITSGTLRKLADAAVACADLPSEFVCMMDDDSLRGYSATLEGEYTVAEVLQMCANAAQCVMRLDRYGVLFIEPMNRARSGYNITANLSYYHPEVELTKPLKAVEVKYGEDLSYVLSTGNVGETQTVENPLVSTEAQAAAIANWVRAALEPRTIVAGNFRADPRLDVFDIVTVESKYGVISPVAITDITYSYGGSFRTNYVGRVIGDVSEVEMFVLNESRLGEGVL